MLYWISLWTFLDCGWGAQLLWSIQHVLQHSVRHYHRIHWYSQLFRGRHQLLHRPLLSLLLPLPAGISHQQHSDCSVSIQTLTLHCIFHQWQQKAWLINILHAGHQCQWPLETTMVLSLTLSAWESSMWVGICPKFFTLNSKYVPFKTYF